MSHASFRDHIWRSWVGYQHPKGKETQRDVPPGKAETRESTFTQDPRPKRPLDRGAALDTARRMPPFSSRPSPSCPFRLALPPLPLLSTSRRLTEWEREERRSIASTYYYGLLTRRALTPKVVLTRPARAAAKWRCPSPLFSCSHSVPSLPFLFGLSRSTAAPVFLPLSCRSSRRALHLHAFIGTTNERWTAADHFRSLLARCRGGACVLIRAFARYVLVKRYTSIETGQG